MITLSFDGTDRRVAVALRERGAKLIAAETRALDISMLELQAAIQRKLSGEVLKTRRGGAGLLGSVRRVPTVSDGTRIYGSVQAGGGLFWWAAVHERGGEKTYDIYPVNKKALAFFPAGSAGAALGRSAMTKIRFASGAQRGSLKPAKFAEASALGSVIVKHVVHPPLRQRSFMRTALLELRGRIIERAYRAAAGALR